MKRASAVVVALLVVWTMAVVATAATGDGPEPYDPASVDLSEPAAAVAADALREATTRDVTVASWRECMEDSTGPREDGLCRHFVTEFDRDDGEILHRSETDAPTQYWDTCYWVKQSGDAGGQWVRSDLFGCIEYNETRFYLATDQADLAALDDVRVVEETPGTLVLRVADTPAVYSLWTHEPNRTAGTAEDVSVPRATATLRIDKASGHLRRLDLRMVRVEDTENGTDREVVHWRLTYSDWDSTEVERPAGVGYSIWEALGEIRTRSDG